MIVLLPLLAALGDTPMQPRDKRVADLVQLAIELPETVTPEERSRAFRTLEADTTHIRSCTDAERLADCYRRETTFAVKVTTRSNYPVGWMPLHLHDELVALPVGRATKVFVEKTTARVLIACSPPKFLPNRANPPAP